MRLSGKDIAEKIYQTLQSRVKTLQNKNVTPHLVVFLIGENPASVAYVKQKQSKGEAIGCKVTVLHFEETVTTEVLEKKLTELNDDPTVHAILIQRPVPDHIDINKLELLTNPEKDIDGFHPDSPYTFPIPLAVMRIIEEVYEETKGTKGTKGTKETEAKKTFVPSVSSVSSRTFLDWLQSKNIVIIGKGPTGGGPIISEFNKRNINHYLIDSKTPNREELLKNADIVISAVGQENIIKAAELKQNVILVGVGILRGTDGKLHGDYNEDAVENVASYYTPTPGGVGPVNVAMLMENLLTATEKQTA